MSWDIVMIRTKDKSEKVEELKEENTIPFSNSEIAEELKIIASMSGASYDYKDSYNHTLINDEWLIEFRVGRDEKTSSITLSIRGEEEPKNEGWASRQH